MTRTDELRDRLLGFRPTDVVWGWVGPGLIALVGGVLRFWSLGRPQALVFDETYYVKQGYSMIRYGVEMHTLRSLKKPDVPFAQGNPDVFSSTEGDYVVHPPVGKWVIGAGEWLFGADNGVGWRFSVALLGTISILVVGRVARRMFGSTALGCVASFLLAFEGLHFVMSRTGILDIIVMFFALCAFAALLVDRDHSRAVLAEKVGALGRGEWPGGGGPWLGWRPWRWVAGISLGLCTGTKISGLFFIAAFGLMTVWWDLGARRAAGVRHWARGALLVDGPFAAVQTVLTAAVVYLVSWSGWFLTDHGYNRHWAQDHPGEGVQWLPPALRSLVDYHRQQLAFNTSLDDTHPYMSNPWSWLVQTRPTSFYYESPAQGVDGCSVAQCSQAINPVGTVSVWWLGILALLVVLWWWLVRRDWRAGGIAAGIVGGYLPWFFFQGRTIFTFYAVAFEPWVVLAVTFVLGLWVRQAAGDPRRWRVRVLVVGGYLLLTLALFAWFHPIYVADTIPYDHWRWRMWFPSWI